jgi:hypothetical protein
VFNVVFQPQRTTPRFRVRENTMLRRIFGSKREMITGRWRKMRNEELHNFHSSENIIRVIKSRKVRWGWVRF